MRLQGKAHTEVGQLPLAPLRVVSEQLADGAHFDQATGTKTDHLHRKSRMPEGGSWSR